MGIAECGTRNAELTATENNTAAMVSRETKTNAKREMRKNGAATG